MQFNHVKYQQIQLTFYEGYKFIGITKSIIQGILIIVSVNPRLGLVVY